MDGVVLSQEGRANLTEGFDYHFIDLELDPVFSEESMQKTGFWFDKVLISLKMWLFGGPWKSLVILCLSDFQI